MTDREALEAWLDKPIGTFGTTRRAYFGAMQITAARDAWAAAREECAAIVEKWSDASHLTLHAGEMTAQELRTAQAVINGITADIRASM